ncbi:hypothetical protein [Mycobacteroides abscessus]|uniref:hypothetical protein n=1 Tax=Mycobacteroides abscessus TaxID=36809 RepID=UPI00092B2D86|nr:hypothetical protein [Mycobacteroides abscessus]SKT73540.1 Uncharacterised protein [Mycobacteroides abscessus subsp. abscessus]SHV28135.1 Uncharacterised protein [Mycobacteroides abscessus subsp. bolletii]SHX93458.1 Uncharacterised protein [Mycobacteroides abscessus subsp. bolletii]SHY03083.1 Uncharacterised protein [Mycobacteroides abscessus subsp. bolletii]SHY65848.1 Uncharacterised protein [Mycobacteroides abscessus subsp. bolletii]
MTQAVRWTREQQANTLAGISVIREVKAGGEQYASADGLREVVEALDRFGEATDADGMARLVTGVTNAAVALLDWIEAEANNKAILLAKVRQSVPDFEEPDDYPTDPAWSTWSGVLRAVEKNVKAVPLSD